MSKSEIDKLLDEIIEALEARPLDRERLKALWQRANELVREAADPEDRVALRDAIRDLEGVLGPMNGTARHDPEAERLMEEAEQAWLERNYRKTVSLCNQILEIEPKWERAQDLKYKAEEYQAGRIPPEDLPPEALLPFEKAKSALRVRRYDAAKGYIQEVHDALKGRNITSFTELVKLEAQLEQELLAWKVYEEGLSLLSEGKWEEAIQKIMSAADASGLPEHRAKAEALRKDWEQIEKIREQVYGDLSVEEMVQTARALQGMESRYRDNPVLVALEEELSKRISGEIAAREKNIKQEMEIVKHSKDFQRVQEGFKKAEEEIGELRKLHKIQETDIEALEKEIDKARLAIESWETQGKVKLAEKKIEAAREAPTLGQAQKDLEETERIINELEGAQGAVLQDDVQALKTSLDEVKREIKRWEIKRDKKTVEQKIKEAREAKTIRQAKEALKTAEEIVTRLENSKVVDVQDLQEEINSVRAKIEQAEDLLHRAQIANEQRGWLRRFRASRWLAKVQDMYPGDRGVKDLAQKLAWVDRLKTLGRVVLALLVLVAFGFLAQYLVAQRQAYLLSLTPSPTPTATFTPTPTATFTPTPTPTLTPTATPTPMTLVTKHLVWARTDCYEDYPAVGSIPPSASVRLLPTERRFDKLNRECVLVEYKSTDRTVTGWVLLIDLGP